MRINGDHLDRYRAKHPLWGKTEPGLMFGYFIVPGKYGNLDVISSGAKTSEAAGRFEHVSVSTKTRCPFWEEMAIVKDLFWHENETVIQIHPPKKDYVNAHPYCLHLWKPPYQIQLPPKGTLV